MISYDHGEERSGIPQRLRQYGLELVPRSLRVGDYVLSDRLVVMRLTERRLIALLRGGRLFDRISALKRDFLVVVLMIQRGAGPPPPRGQRAALAWILREGVSVLVVEERDDAAAWIARLAAQENGAEPPPAAIGRKADHPDRLLEQLVAWLPGVSAVGARRLLAHFGSLKALFSAREAEIMDVRGFGPRRSAAIAEIASRPYRGAGRGSRPRTRRLRPRSLSSVPRPRDVKGDRRGRSRA